MAKKRIEIPKSIREKILDEYYHLCAVCRKQRPQLHHIDNNPSNNDLMNLIPLCPNTHLIDVHNPTQPIEPEKIRLLRKFKDPTVLTSQFHPLFIRVRFLDEIKPNVDVGHLGEKVSELAEFVKQLEMGEFYASRINNLLEKPSDIDTLLLGGPPDPREEIERKRRAEQRSREYAEKLRNARDEIYLLIVELLRFQSWRLEIKNMTDLGTS